MQLSYKLILEAIPEAKGYVKEDLYFSTFSLLADVEQPKGMYVPALGKASGELKEAIANGAIGAIWSKKEELPSYTPNHFPVFYTNDLKEGIRNMIERYDEVVKKHNNQTKFIFSKETSLNGNFETYDIAVIKEYLEHMKGGE